MAFVEIKDLIKIYHEPRADLQVPALRGIELSLRRGELSTLIGPSGAGKSTFLRLLAGLDKPSSGEIWVDGKPVHKLKNFELSQYQKHDIGIMWQHPEDNLLPHLTAFENIEFPLLYTDMPREPRHKRVNELLKKIGLQDRATHSLSRLSGGEAQRISIAVALAHNPKLVVLDEPTGELDSLTTLEIIEFLKELNKDYGITMLVATHDIRFERSATKSYHLRDGTITAVRLLTGKALTTEQAMDLRVQDTKEEFGYIDEFGTLRIPRELLIQAGISKHVKLIAQAGRIIVEKWDNGEEP